MAAENSIIPSMPMFTTPERSHQRPAIAPSAIGVPGAATRRGAASRWCSARVRQRERQDDHQRDEQHGGERAARRCARRGQRRSKNVATATEHEDRCRSPRRSTAGSKLTFERIGGRLEGEALVGGVEVAAHVADQEHAEEPVEHADRLAAAEAEPLHVRPPSGADRRGVEASRGSVPSPGRSSGR